MKIHSIAIQNLHSLASSKPIIIDFLQQPLQGCGLFAITGPTGAGKTTILDGLTLALYGEIAREGDSKEVMSHGEGQCSAEVIFETSAGCYKARWALHRANKKAGGKFQNAVREIACWKTKNILATKVAEVEKLVEELVGLNKEQFLKSVLLAQGQFMDFLKADKNERALLLEKLTGTEIYRGLSKTCFEKHKEEKAVLDALQRETSTTALLSEEAKKALTAEIEKAQQEAQGLRQELSAIEAGRQWHQRSKTLLKEEESLAQSLQKAQNQKAQHAAEFDRWENHCRIAPIAPSLEQWRDKETEHKKQAQDGLSLEQSAQESTITLKEKEAVLASCTAEKETSEARWQDAEPKLLEALKDEEKKARLAEDIGREKAAQKALSEKAVSLSQKIAEQETQVRQIQEQQQRLAQWLAQNSSDGQLAETIKEASAHQIHIATLRTEAQAIQKEIRLTTGRCEALEKNLLHLRQSHQAATKAFVKRQERQEEIGREKSAWKYTVLTKQAFLIEEKQRLEKVQKEAGYQTQALQFYLEHHQKLEAGKPCHLCGNTVHPYADRDLSGMQQTLQTQQQLLGKLQEQLATQEAEDCIYSQMLYLLDNMEPVADAVMLTSNVPDVQLRSLQQLLQEEEDLRVHLAQIRRDMESGTAQIGEVSTAFHKEQLELARLQSDEQELRNDGSRLGQYFQLTAGRLRMECPKNGEDVFVNALREKQRLYEQKKEAKSTLEIRVLDMSKLLQNLRREKEDLRTNCKQTEARILQDEATYKQLCEAIRLAHPATFDSVATYYRYLKETTERAIEKWQIASGDFNAAAQRHALAVQEWEAHKTRQTQLEEELKTLVEMLREELKKLGLPEDLSGALANLIPASERQETERKVRQIEGACVEAETLLSAKKKERTHHTEEGVSARPLEVLEAEWNVLQKESEVLQQQIGRNGQILAENAQQEAQLSGKLELQRRQEAEVARWRTLNDLIGSGNGDKLAGFAQTLSLEHLLAHANVHLQQLSDRYRLRRKTDSKESLGIQVEDLYLGGALREAGSLSGGETFLVSLGLALGLSDMASQKTRIDSLFIDEGFGSLDSEALEDALTTLENLQARGKTIGIISHVEQLKERIPTQIRVQKKGSGISSIEVVAG